ncbi:MAG: hypothetical protein ABL309_07355 [Phycisphaerales bacterium]
MTRRVSSWVSVAGCAFVLVCAPGARGDAIDQINGAELFNPIPSWEKWEGAPTPPDATVTGQVFFDIFHVSQLTRVHAVEAAVEFGPSGAETLLNTKGVIVHLDGPNAFEPRASWGNTSLPGAPNSGIIDDGVAPGIDLYRRQFGTPFGLAPGTYALAVFGFENDFISSFSDVDPAEFKVFQSSVGDEEGFVWPATAPTWSPPFLYEFDFGNYEIQFVNAAYRLETTIIPAPGVLALGLPAIAFAGRRRR